MKKYIILFCISIMFISTACSDSLDKEIEGELPFDEVDYTKTENMFHPVSGVYARARTADGFSRWTLIGLMAVRGDDTNKGGTPSDQAVFQLCKEFKYKQISDYWGLNAAWNGLYNLTAQCNASLEMLDNYKVHLKKESDLKLNAQYQAEVRFIRAYAYFYIVRLWGDIPIVLNNNDVFDNPPMKILRDDVYGFINEELDYCIANLADARPNEMPYKGQVTKYTALALKAKANADINQWQEVLTTSNELINSGKFSLYTDYYQYFKKPGKLADETLYELQYDDVQNPTYASDHWFIFQGPGQLQGASAEMGTGWGFLPPSDELVKLFVDRGETIRYKTNFIFRGTTTEEGDSIKAGNLFPQYNGKAYLPSNQLTDKRTDYGSGNNIRMLRYADVLLLNAEAKVQLGQNGDEPFNEVRRRAQMSELTGVNLDQILEERRVEFACEWGERFFDLVRTNKAQGILPNFIKGEHEFFPVPQEQVDLNPALK